MAQGSSLLMEIDLSQSLTIIMDGLILDPIAKALSALSDITGMQIYINHSLRQSLLSFDYIS